MNSSFRVETGVQLLARLTQRPLLNLWPLLRMTGLSDGAIIEISGLSASGKSVLAADAACNALIPKECGGSGAGVVIFHTDGNFDINRVIFSLKEKLINSLATHHEEIGTWLRETMKNLAVAHIFDSVQFLITLETLDSLLTEDPNISLVIIDTLTAFYWSDQNIKLQKMDVYLRNLLGKVHKVTKEHKVTLLYTKPEYFGSKDTGGQSVGSHAEAVITKIQVREKDSSENIFCVTKSGDQNGYCFKIEGSTLMWLK